MINIQDRKRFLIYGKTEDAVDLAIDLLQNGCRVLIATDIEHSIEFRRKSAYYCRGHNVPQKNTSTITLPDRIEVKGDWTRRLYNTPFDALFLLPPDKGLEAPEELQSFWGRPRSSLASPGVKHMENFTAAAVSKMKAYAPVFFLNWSVRAAVTIKSNKASFLRRVADLGPVRERNLLVASLTVDKETWQQGLVTPRLGKLSLMNRRDLVLQREFYSEYVR